MEKYDIKIEGIGTISEGKYKNIKIDGMGTIQGETEAEYIKIDGKSKSLGKIKCDELKVDGYFTSYDDININTNCEVNGYQEVKGSIKGKYLEVNGRLSAEKEVSFDKVQVNGEFITLGDCKCEEFYLDGKVNISGLLSGDNLELNISKINEIKEIGGEKLSVRRSKSYYKVLFFNMERKGKLICNEIEADEIYLEHTECNIVRGRNIEIGEGCIIETIEYTGDLKENGNSKIKNKVFL